MTLRRMDSKREKKSGNEDRNCQMKKKKKLMEEREPSFPQKANKQTNRQKEQHNRQVKKKMLKYNSRC